MADVTIGTLAVYTDSQVQGATAGETVTAGQVVYRLSTDGEMYLGDADDAAKDDITGIVLIGGGDGESILILSSGGIDLGATLTVGEVYVLSTTAGGIAPIGDLLAGDFVTILGVAKAANRLQLDISVSSTAKA